MRLENLSAQDARRVLCERKYFGMRPQPLEQHLYALNLSQCAERVFWLHWDAGYRRGDFTSEVPISEVARRVRANTSTVTRAYQTLKQHGLIRRQDPGRDPSRPFCQATAVTEVLLPREALQELLNAPERAASIGAPASRTAEPTVSQEQEHTARTSQAVPTAPTPDEVRRKQVRDEIQAKHGRHAVDHIFSKFSDAERPEFFAAQRNAQAGQPYAWSPAANSKLDATEVLWLQYFLDGYAQDARKRRQPESSSKASTPGKAGLRQLSTFSLAYLRKQLTQHIPAADVDMKFREIVWAVEEGALIKFEPRFAVNIALKKLKDGVWTRPNRMPPNWRRAVA